MKPLMSLILCATLALGSCETVVDRAIDHVGDRTEQIINDVTPRIIESFLNADAIAFLIVSVVILGGLVVVIALWLLLGTTRAWWKQLDKYST